MVKTDAVEGVLKRKATLNLMGLDHTLENILNGDILAGAGQMVRNCEDRTEVVRRVTPLGCEPAVVEVQPADDRSNVESATDRIQLVVSSGYLGSYARNSEQR